MSRAIPIFETQSSALSIGFFLAVIVLGLCLPDIRFQLSSVLVASVFLVMAKGIRALPWIAWIAVVASAIALVNPLFSDVGDAVLFMGPFDRPYTFQALLTGAMNACVFASTTLWLVCFSATVSSQAILEGLGAKAPALSMVLMMVLRFSPMYARSAVNAMDGRKVMGLSGKPGLRGAFQDASSSLLGVLSNAFEDCACSIESMRNRGYGSRIQRPKAKGRLSRRDMAEGGVMLCALAAVIVLWVAWHLAPSSSIGALGSSFMMEPTMLDRLCLAAYVAFLCTPILFNLMENLVWHFTTSRT